MTRSTMTTTLVCDKLWGRYTCDWFCKHFPEMKGKTLVFHSNAAVEFVHRPLMLEWLTVNRYL